MDSHHAKGSKYDNYCWVLVPAIDKTGVYMQAAEMNGATKRDPWRILKNHVHNCIDQRVETFKQRLKKLIFDYKKKRIVV